MGRDATALGEASGEESTLILFPTEDTLPACVGSRDSFDDDDDDAVDDDEEVELVAEDGVSSGQNVINAAGSGPRSRFDLEKN